MGELIKRSKQNSEEPVTLDTFGGKIHVEWDPQGAVSPLGQLPFFIEFLKVSGLYDDFIETCPLEYKSPMPPAYGMLWALFYCRFWLDIIVMHISTRYDLME